MRENMRPRMAISQTTTNDDNDVGDQYGCGSICVKGNIDLLRLMCLLFLFCIDDAPCCIYYTLTQYARIEGKRTIRRR